MYISVNIATHKKREESLKKCLQRILNQDVEATIINVYLNDYKIQPWQKELEGKTQINFIEGEDLGAAAKFWYADSQEKGVYITLDDDLKTHPAYIKRLVDGVFAYPNSVVGFHGTRYNAPIKSYFHDKNRETYYCVNPLKNDIHVDMLGTGVLAFRVSMDNHPTLDWFPEPRMTDPYMMKNAREKKVSLVCLGRTFGLVQEIDGSQADAIWKSARDNDSKQTKIVQSAKGERIRPLNIMDKVSRLTKGSLEWGHIKEILSHKGNLLEFGSGLSTEIFKASNINVTSFEHDKDYVKNGVKYKPLEDGWYKLTKTDLKLIGKADLILVDAPKGKNRCNLPIEILPKTATIFVDDCHRFEDMALAHRIAKNQGRNITILDGVNKKFAIID